MKKKGRRDHVETFTKLHRKFSSDALVKNERIFVQDWFLTATWLWEIKSSVQCKSEDKISAKFQPAHGGADFRQNFGQQTAAQIFAEISASTRRRRLRPQKIGEEQICGAKP